MCKSRLCKNLQHAEPHHGLQGFPCGCMCPEIPVDQ